MTTSPINPLIAEILDQHLTGPKLCEPCKGYGEVETDGIWDTCDCCKGSGLKKEGEGGGGEGK